MLVINLVILLIHSEMDRHVLLGEIKAEDGKLFDIQLKGSGKTRFSRQGDGRSPLGPVIREYILSEAIHFFLEYQQPDLCQL